RETSHQRRGSAHYSFNLPESIRITRKCMISNNFGMRTIERNSICRALLPFVTVIEFLAGIPSRKKIPCNVVMKINQARKDVTVRLYRGLRFIVAVDLKNFVARD